MPSPYVLKNDTLVPLSFGYSYSDNDSYTTLSLPYGSGDRWCMTILLPKEGNTIADVVSSLQQQSWQHSSSKAYEVDVQIPRFTTSTDIVLNDVIAQMGCTSMFTDEADFSSMTDKNTS